MEIVNKNWFFFPSGLDIPKEDFENSRDFAKKSLQYLKKSEYSKQKFFKSEDIYGFWIVNNHNSAKKS